MKHTVQTFLENTDSKLNYTDYESSRIYSRTGTQITPNPRTQGTKHLARLRALATGGVRLLVTDSDNRPYESEAVAGVRSENKQPFALGPRKTTSKTLEIKLNLKCVFKLGQMQPLKQPKTRIQEAAICISQNPSLKTKTPFSESTKKTA
ncbi:hypothetical protein L596_017754 [Steinernema carpocapsae]|uniref:Uncharacterized protein n=1 Tax=Steinernema carpocapsae TaxID=34508 RepID=A0A4U5N3A8_STECR|nr:hypothetical protein L596_017754 [Steinernema carpocapsae]